MSQTPLAWNIAPGQLVIIQGDITSAEVAAIVTAANPQLAGGGGVDGAVHKAAGPKLLAACQDHVRANRAIFPGGAVITPGFELKAQYVIHAVGPIWLDGSYNEDKILASAYQASLDLAKEHGLATIAFPAISCGAYGFPVDRAANIALSTLRDGLSQGVAKEIQVHLFSENLMTVWGKAATTLLGPAV